MTIMMNKQPGPPPPGVAPWSIMPGWGVVADLTPPELIEMRRMKVLRKVIAGSLAAVLLLCIGGYVLAMLKASGAHDDLDKTRALGTQLTVDGTKFNSIVNLQTTTQGVNQQIAGVMSTNVDVSSVLAGIRRTLPNTMSLTSVNVSLTPATAAAAVTTTGTTGTSGTGTVIGTVTLSGSSQKLVDLAGYATALAKLRGVTNVLPTNNATAGTGSVASWTLTLSLTDALYSHKFDAKPTGGH